MAGAAASPRAVEFSPSNRTLSETEYNMKVSDMTLRVCQGSSSACLVSFLTFLHGPFHILPRPVIFWMLL